MQATQTTPSRPLLDPTISPATRALTPAVWVAFAWFAIAVPVSATGVFARPGPPIGIALAAALPPLLAVAAAFGSARFRSWARSLDLRLLTLLQTWRIGGLGFLALASVHALPDGFAIPAGYGDITVSLTAPLVALYVIGRGAARRRIFVAWTVFGILDLVVAVTLGVLYSGTSIGLLTSGVDTDLMGSPPMVLIPVFGVPLTLVLHVISIVIVTAPSKSDATD